MPCWSQNPHGALWAANAKEPHPSRDRWVWYGWCCRSPSSAIDGNARRIADGALVAPHPSHEVEAAVQDLAGPARHGVPTRRRAGGRPNDYCGRPTGRRHRHRPPDPAHPRSHGMRLSARRRNLTIAVGGLSCWPQGRPWPRIRSGGQAGEAARRVARARRAAGGWPPAYADAVGRIEAAEQSPAR